MYASIVVEDMTAETHHEYEGAILGIICASFQQSTKSRQCSEPMAMTRSTAGEVSTREVSTLLQYCNTGTPTAVLHLAVFSSLRGRAQYD